MSENHNHDVECMPHLLVCNELVLGDRGEMYVTFSCVSGSVAVSV